MGKTNKFGLWQGTSTNTLQLCYSSTLRLSHTGYTRFISKINSYPFSCFFHFSCARCNAVLRTDGVEHEANHLQRTSSQGATQLAPICKETDKEKPSLRFSNAIIEQAKHSTPRLITRSFVAILQQRTRLKWPCLSETGLQDRIMAIWRKWFFTIVWSEYNCEESGTSEPFNLYRQELLSWDQYSRFLIR